MRRRDFLPLVGALASAWPLAGRAQQKAMLVIGYLHFGSPGPFAYQLVPFRQGLAQNGYVEGQNVAIETRWAEVRQLTFDRGSPAYRCDTKNRDLTRSQPYGPLFRRGGQAGKR
jgi:hypothetical protein